MHKWLAPDVTIGQVAAHFVQGRPVLFRVGCYIHDYWNTTLLLLSRLTDLIRIQPTAGMVVANDAPNKEVIE